MKTWRVLSALLNYPTEELVSSVPEIKDILCQEGLLSPEDREALAPLLADLAGLDIYDLQARYVELFDQNRALSLHLFEHVHGESRDRGRAMVSLRERYQEAGLELCGAELPDFLPVFLEFLSVLPREEAQRELADAAAVIGVLARRLSRRCSVYAPALTVLARAAGEKPGDSEAAEQAAEEAEESEGLQAVDDEWQEEPVDFLRREASLAGRQRARAQGAAFRKEQ